jgi:predicted RNA polymerase sigma factor
MLQVVLGFDAKRIASAFLVAPGTTGQRLTRARMALILYVEARRAARRGESAEYIPLTEQEPARWDSRMIGEAEAMLRRRCFERPSKALAAGCHESKEG